MCKAANVPFGASIIYKTPPMQKIYILLLATFFFTSYSSDEDSSITKLIEIEFKATCDTKCNASAFIQRGNDIIWQENIEFTDQWELNHKANLDTDDKVLLFVIPSDGQVHLIKTEIYIDGELQANQNKVCHAGGGCSFTKGN